MTTPKSKLTKTQFEALMRLSKATEFYGERGTLIGMTRWECVPYLEQKTMDSLVGRKLAEKTEPFHYRITDAGRAALTTPKLTETQRKALQWLVRNAATLDRLYRRGLVNVHEDGVYVTDAGLAALTRSMGKP